MTLSITPSSAVVTTAPSAAATTPPSEATNATNPTPPPVTTNAPPPGATAGAALELVERARADLLEASHSRDVVERHRQSRLGAMRAAAALVSARGRGVRSGGPQSLWELVPAVAPELTEWAEFFALATAPAEPLHRTAVSAREADDLLRQAETFIGLVCRRLGLPVTSMHHDVLVPTAWA